MNGDKEIIVKPDPSIILQKILPLCKFKSVVIGLAFLGIGVIWYLKNIGIVSSEIFWPLIFVIIGLGFLVKGVHRS